MIGIDLGTIKAKEEGLARVSKTSDQVYSGAMFTIQQTRRALDALMREGVIRTAM